MAANVVANARGKKATKTSRTVALWENIKSLAGAILIYLVINTFLIAAYRIPSGSMIPTLLIGDWLFVNKAVYGPHIPFTQTHLPSFSEPKRGEVIVFESPYQADQAAENLDPTPTLVKRMVGMPGDTLYMRAGLLYVNGVPQRQGFGIVSQPTPSTSQPNDVSALFDWQHKIELKQSRFGAAPAQPRLDNWGPLVVPAANYFMMGDNRYESKDSRYWGTVPRENIRGRPSFVYYSYKSGNETDRPLPFITDIRWGRIGTRIH
ncbi:MAG: Signal peptidase [Gemmatimonadetes bacterium]|jgi:signal peptidase I|nr:Signal peptidase [Gemmatimonadota bacterium]